MMSHRPKGSGAEVAAPKPRRAAATKSAAKRPAKRTATRKPSKKKPPTRQPVTARQLVLTPSPTTLADPVLRATYDSIMEVGVRRTTLVDVARRAGVSRMTVYRKYDDLPRLLSALLTVELGSLLESARVAGEELPDARSRLTHTVTNTVAALAAHPVLTKILAIDPDAMVPFMVDRLGATQQLALEQLREFITSGQAATGDGSIRDGDAHIMALTILGYAQSFVFSARAFVTADPLGRIYPELELLTSRYLDPGIADSPHGSK